MNRDYIGFEINEVYLEELIEPTIGEKENEFWG